MKGRVLCGINNIYTVLMENGASLECRFKGKKLKEDVRRYNPLAPGDQVEVEVDSHDFRNGMILKRFPRHNAFERFNKKRFVPQVLAANVDQLLCLLSTREPPFRPRFADRILASCEFAGIPAVLAVNKIDFGLEDEQKKRLAYFRKMNYPVFEFSVKTGEGLEEFKAFLENKISVFTGQSGVGKSSLLNALDPGIQQKTGEISSRYNRGRHTTVYGLMVPWTERGAIIDTPGIREFHVAEIDSGDLGNHYRDIYALAGHCRIPRCTHIHEPGCAVRQAVEVGDIPADRFEGYQTLLNDLKIQESRGRW